MLLDDAIEEIKEEFEAIAYENDLTVAVLWLCDDSVTKVFSSAIDILLNPENENNYIQELIIKKAKERVG